MATKTKPPAKVTLKQIKKAYEAAPDFGSDGLRRAPKRPPASKPAPKPPTARSRGTSASDAPTSASKPPMVLSGFCVYDQNGRPNVASVSGCHETSINGFVKHMKTKYKWEEWQRMGYRCLPMKMEAIYK